MVNAIQFSILEGSGEAMKALIFLWLESMSELWHVVWPSFQIYSHGI